jgi:NADH dehydrogenase (ubiquinone) 1 beta subcomplex subunit 10
MPEDEEVRDHIDKVPKDVYEEGLFGRKYSQLPTNPFMRFFNRISTVIDGPVTWFRETVVVPNREKTYFYHQKFRRVPTIDECYTDDVACQFEADQQFRRDRKVDSRILEILRNRMAECVYYHGMDEAQKCKPLRDEYEESLVNWFLKYGDQSMYMSCVEAYMKQKHRMIWDRRQKELAEQK